MNRIFKNTKALVRDNVPTDDFLNTLTDAGAMLLKTEPAIFDAERLDGILAWTQRELGPFISTEHKAACAMEALRCLASFESSYNWTTGKDPANKSPDPNTWEAGVFQVSYNSIRLDKSLKAMCEGRDIFDAQSFVHDQKNDHAFACAYAIKLLLVTTRANGPAVRREINPWLKREAVQEFLSFLVGGHADTTIPPVVPATHSVLSIGDKGMEVGVLQRALNSKGASLKVDNDFGPATENAARAFQAKSGLVPDGIIGPKTWIKLGEETTSNTSPVITAPKVPASYAEVVEIFGPPCNEDNLAFCEVPEELTAFPHLTALNGKRGFRCHKLLVEEFGAVFKEIVSSGLAPLIKTFDGCYNCRNIAGSTSTSLHSFGIATDLNADENERGDWNGKMDQRIVDIFAKHNFWWGGWFHQIPDMMHFEWRRYA